MPGSSRDPFCKHLPTGIDEGNEFMALPIFPPLHVDTKPVYIPSGCLFVCLHTHLNPPT
jgi:hypothetical protein